MDKKLMMRRDVRTALLRIAMPLALQPMFAQAPSPKPLTLPLECALGDCPLTARRAADGGTA